MIHVCERLPPLHSHTHPAALVARCALYYSGRAQVLAARGVPAMAVSCMHFLVLLVVTASACTMVVISRIPSIRSSPTTSAAFLALPICMLLWGSGVLTHISGAHEQFSATMAGRAFLCAVPYVGLVLYLRLLLWDLQPWGLPSVQRPNHPTRRWMCAIVCSMSLAVGCMRVHCYPDGLIAPLARTENSYDWWAQWVLSTIVGIVPIITWRKLLERSAVIARDPMRWKPGWAWWSMPHRQYILFLMLLLAPLLRVAGHVGALFADSSLPPTVEPVGLISPLLALGALLVCCLGLDFAAEAEVAAAAAQRAIAEQQMYDDDYDSRSDASGASVDSYGESYRGTPSDISRPALSAWNLAAWFVIVGAELPQSVAALYRRIDTGGCAPAGTAADVVREGQSAASGGTGMGGGAGGWGFSGWGLADAAAETAMLSGSTLGAPSGCGNAGSGAASDGADGASFTELLGKAVWAELPDDQITLAAAVMVALLTFCALQLTEWRPRSGWVWLPGGGGGAALGLFAIAIAPQAVLPSGLCFWCAVSASELFTLSEHAAERHAIDPRTGMPIRLIVRWLPPRIFATLASSLWLAAVVRVLLAQPPVHPAAWAGSKALYALELQLLLAAWWACGSCERERGAVRPPVLCRALLAGFRTLLHFALAARLLSELLLPANFPLAFHAVLAATATTFLSLLVALTCTRGAASGTLRENASKLTECGLLSAAVVRGATPG